MISQTVVRQTMIWQLMKRDFAWKAFTPIAVLGFALIAALGAFLPPPTLHPTREALRESLGLSFGGGMFFMIVLAQAVQSPWNLFQAALPISGRDIWLSQLLALLALIWLPALTACAGGLSPTPILVAAAIYTTFVMAAQCLRIRQIRAPRWFRALGFPIAMLLIAGMPFIAREIKSLHLTALPSAGSVLAILAFASLTLFWWGWTHVPASFQFEPAAQFAPPAEGDSLPLIQPRARRSPIFLSIYGGLSMSLVVVFVTGSLALGQFGAAPVFAGIPQSQIRGRCRWLLALPFPAKKLFALIALPAAAAAILGSLANIFLMTNHPLSARARFVEIAAELASVYLVIFLTELPAWRRLSQLPAWARWVPFGLACAAAIAFALGGAAVFQSLAGALPEPWWQLAAVLALPVIATYWLAEKAFVEREYRALYIETVNYSRPLR